MHKKDKSLRLRKETLRQLSPLAEDELRQVNGGKRLPISGKCTTSLDWAGNE